MEIGGGIARGMRGFFSGILRECRTLARARRSILSSITPYERSPQYSLEEH
jgi:hypothetical protein